MKSHFLDIDGYPVTLCVACSIIKKRKDNETYEENPVYHESNGIGCYLTIIDSLENRLKIAFDDIGVQLVSICHDKEAAYSSDRVGVDGLLIQRLNPAIFSVTDPLHGVESLWADAKKEVPEIDDSEDVISSHHAWFSHSNKRKRSARHVAIAKEENWISLKRFVKTRSVAHAKLAYGAELSQVGILEDTFMDWAANNPEDTEAMGLCNKMLHPEVIPYMTICADVATALGDFCEKSQSERESNIFAAHDRLVAFKEKLEHMKSEDPETCRYNHFFRKNLAELKKGKYQNVTLKMTNGPMTRSASLRNSRKIDDVLNDCKKLQKKILTVLLENFDDRLDEHEIVQLFLKIFDFENYSRDPTVLKTQFDTEFVKLASMLSEGKLQFPMYSCSNICDGPSCKCLLNQFERFKNFVMSPSKQERYKKDWFTSLSLRRGGDIKVLKVNEKITEKDFDEYAADKKNWEDGEVHKYYKKTNKLSVMVAGHKRKICLNDKIQARKV